MEPRRAVFRWLYRNTFRAQLASIAVPQARGRHDLNERIELSCR